MSGGGSSGGGSFPGSVPVGATPTAAVTATVQEASLAGAWTGTTAQGKPISFNITGETLSSLSIGFATAGCLQVDSIGSGSYTSSNGPSVASRSFVASVPSPFGNGTVIVNGTFQSDTQASGTLRAIIFS